MQHFDFRRATVKYRRLFYIRVPLNSDTELCSMENKNRLSCEQAKNLDLVAYLCKLGYEPARIRNGNYWYLSPLRNERTPSFKVNKRLNRWYDHGIGKVGNLVDFGVLYHQCTVAELLQILSRDFSFQQHILEPPAAASQEEKIIVERTCPLSSPQLLQYLRDRAILIDVTLQYCVEVHYSVAGKCYYAIGLENDSGGYELRSPYFKGSSAPKDITTIKNGHYNAVVFEGLFDFLSCQTYYYELHQIRRGSGHAECDYLILNSISLFEKARPFMEQHQTIHLCLDRDTAGQNCSLCAIASSDKYLDGSSWYKGYKDINLWLVNDGGRKRDQWLCKKDDI